MAIIDVVTNSKSRRLERVLVGSGLLAAAVVETSSGHAAIAGALAAFALLLLSMRRGAEQPDRASQGILAAVDFLAVAAFGALSDPSGVLWRAPSSLDGVFALTPGGAGAAAFIYLTGAVVLTGRSPLAIRAALFTLPFLFSLLIALGSPVGAEIGRMALLGGDAPELARVIAGRVFVLFLLNEAVVVGAPLALGRFLPREWRPHGVLFLSAVFAAVTPYIASAVSTYVTPYAPAPITQILATLASAAAQAGLWGETYLVTQSLAGLLRGSASLSVIVYGDWKSGAEKGFVYGLVFMGLLLGANLILAFRRSSRVLSPRDRSARRYSARRSIRWREPSSRAPIRRRRSLAGWRPPICEARISRAAWWLGWAPGWRFISTCRQPAGWTASCSAARWACLVFAGVDVALDAFDLRRERRQHLRSWRVYALGALLGGLVGGAIAWYLDKGQMATIVSQVLRLCLARLSRRRSPVNAYIIRPLFSKWGATDLGLADGGVRVFYDGIAVGRHSVGVRRAAVFDQSVLPDRADAAQPQAAAPARQFRGGLDLLVENAVRVLRWGLWMAPVIYSFLKAAPDPTWYNQDGLVRTGVATWMNSVAAATTISASWSLRYLHGAAGVRRASRPDLVRPHGPAGRDAG